MKIEHKEVFFKSYGQSLCSLLKAYHYEIKIGGTLEEATAIDHNIYLCPFCLKSYFYFKENEYYENEDFTKDHFPPKSVGGKKVMPVCKTCNSGFGLDMDHVLKRYLDSRAFFNKEENSCYPMKFNFQGIDGYYNINPLWVNGKLLLKIPFKKYSEVNKWLFDVNKSGWEFKMKFILESEELIQKAILRAAYLHCFSNWGYDFAFSKTAQRLRNILTGKETHPLINFGVFGDVDPESPTNGFYFIKSPREHQAFVLFFEIGINEPKLDMKVFVVIPGSSEEAWNNLSNFKAWVDNREADTKLIQLFDNCIEREIHFGYSAGWRKLLQIHN